MRKNKGISKGSKAVRSSIHSKYQPSSKELCICWICHADAPVKIGTQERFLAEISADHGFQPCLCKGSMRTVHAECLNCWAKSQYIQALERHENSEELPDIYCPNCKFSYNYTVNESYAYRFKRLKDIHWFSLEVLVLITLLFFQITVVLMDFWLSDKLNREKKGNEENPIVKISNALHLFTVLIVVGAAGFNLLQIYGKEVTVEVLDKNS